MTNIEQLINQAEQNCSELFQEVNTNVEYNQRKVLNAFRNNHVSETHFHSTTGYGYDDLGRDTLESIYRDVFGGEDALVRPQIVSGTHAISTALFSVLRPGDELIYITGAPYDTLEEVIGVRGETSGSMKEYGIQYQEIALNEEGKVSFADVKNAISEKTKVIGIQRSKGYANRPSFTIKEIEEMCQFIKHINPEIIIFVDNCYGEFVEEKEPTQVGADLIAGSLIKNPGGGIVRAGGYIVGKTNLVEKCANRLTAPGLGKEAGATFNMLQEMYQGFFLAPHIVGESLKGAIFTARILELADIETTPHYQDKRTDLIQSINFANSEQMIQFCQAIQEYSPVNSHFTPYPSEMPGYEDEVIMAAGTFIQGASIELTIDGPIRPPYTAYMQGGLTYAHVKIAISEALRKVLSAND
ncbi:MAG TPA: methionine gamma-lyase family protein [Candidatus Avamphibacillus intestinigallinarum]|nr:methionine gamma-lyase family protein [Candidatus Avamphibacillus intestinigallinarum]